MNYTNSEIFAMKKKQRNPQEMVLCPRCGKALRFREVGNSCEVKCPSLNCIKMTVRGL